MQQLKLKMAISKPNVMQGRVDTSFLRVRKIRKKQAPVLPTHCIIRALGVKPCLR